MTASAATLTPTGRPHTGHPRAAIIGAGLGGIAAAVHLKRLGVPLTIFERSDGPGGTWWDNRYPGCTCDIASHYYSYSFRLHEWRGTHATQAEIQDYVEQVIDEFGIREDLRFGTPITRAEWDEDRSLYRLTTAAGEEHEAEILVSALGLLNHPRYPDWPGLDEFHGPAFHTARWEPEHDLTGKHVAVVGTGSTAAQVVPALAGTASKITMFSREPAWVMPKGDHAFSPQELTRFRKTRAKRLERLKIFLRVERTGLAADPQSRFHAQMETICRDYFDQMFADRPDLAAVLRPDYPFQCKRPLITSDLYPALKRDDVELIPHGVQRVTEAGLVDATGREHPVDAIVMATGFEPWNFLTSIDIVGRGGRSLHGVWGEEPEAFLGINVSGFPNLFVLYGPNTNVGSVTAVLERQSEYMAHAVRKMLKRGAATIDVPRPLMDLSNRAIDRANRARSWDGGCSNYYHSSTGRNVTQWPWTALGYSLSTKVGSRLLRVGGRRAEPDVHGSEAQTTARPDRSPAEAAPATA